MKAYRHDFVLLATVIVVCSVPARASKETPRGVTTNVTLWDTGVPLSDPINLTDRTAWKVVPPNLLKLENDPQRALSSPAYYGREYAFQGDAVVENSYLTAVVWSAKGKVVVFSKNSRFEVGDVDRAVGHCTMLQNTGDGVTLQVPFPYSGDMAYFVTRHVERLHEYWAFADDMIKLLRTTESSLPELKAYLDGLLQIVQRIPDQHDVQKENIKSLEYADELSRQTLALLQKKDPQNLPACLDLGKKWRGMGGAQDALLGEYHIVVRRLFQEAGYSCLTQPKAVDVAREVRNRCRQCLRNADGYEIWPNY